MSDYRIAADKLRTVKIAAVRNETPTVKSFTFKDKLCAKAQPGQFVMIWIPDVDEVPMSLSQLRPHTGQAAITVERLGEATTALHKMKTGDVIGLRGPLGNSYTISNAHNVLIVGGGTGLASLMPLTESLVRKRTKVALLMGAKTRKELLFLDRMNRLLSSVGNQLVATTEDGSCGTKGLVTQPAEKILTKNEKLDMVYACGPEQMMYKMFMLCEKFRVPFEASLERFMRCAIGLCGTCLVGKYRVCRDGPVFSDKQLREVKEEFGHSRRGFDGRKIAL